eukprot:6210444-Pleurochrysis_carterae.AAC.1
MKENDAGLSVRARATRLWLAPLTRARVSSPVCLHGRFSTYTLVRTLCPMRQLDHPRTEKRAEKQMARCGSCIVPISTSMHASCCSALEERETHAETRSRVARRGPLQRCQKHAPPGSVFRARRSSASVCRACLRGRACRTRRRQT